MAEASTKFQHVSSPFPLLLFDSGFATPPSPYSLWNDEFL
jgi:hypothetical protein